MKIGKGFRTRRHVEINVRGHAQLSIEENVFLNSGCILTAREKISIGNHTIFGPNVLVYDHDHQIENEKVLSKIPTKDGKHYIVSDFNEFYKIVDDKGNSIIDNTFKNRIS